jgi:hypothetical protein
MSMKLPFIVGGVNCIPALLSLQLLLQDALRKEVTFLNEVEDPSRQKPAHGKALKRIRESVARAATLEELLLLINRAMNGDGSLLARKDLVDKLRSLKMEVSERVTELVEIYPRRRLMLMADVDFLELFAKIIEADN